MTATARRVGGYEIERVIGRGGMATVYLARQVLLDRPVALKELTAFADPDAVVARRFLREAQLAGSFSHPNIVTVHEYFEDGGRPYIAMEYLERGSLREVVGRLSIPQIGGVLQDVLAGLAHAGERGVVHRDLKPENIMVTDQGRAKIADFGIASATSATAPGAGLTTTGTTLGTPRYMSPERALGQEIGPWSDLYSVGVMAYELLAGRTPFWDTEDPVAILMRQINDPVPPLRSVVPELDPALSDWVDRLLVKDPERRTRTADAASVELGEVLGGMFGAGWVVRSPLVLSAQTRTTTPLRADSTAEATVTPSTMPVTPSAKRARRRAPRGALAGLAVGALVMVGLVLAAGGWHGGQAAPGATRVSNGTVALTAPAGWHEATPPGDLPLSSVVRIARTDRSVTAGVIRPGATTQLVGSSTSRTRVTLPGQRLIAWRYRSAQRTVYVAGDAAVVCDRSSPHGFWERCESIAGTLHVTRASTSSPQPAAPSVPVATATATATSPPSPPPSSSGVGDSRSDDPSDDAPDGGEP